jgi:hypothetical protein
VTAEWTVAGRGDFDGDGREDVALARPQPGVVDILHMNGTTIASRVSRNAPSDRWQLVATPDTEGDGTAELLWENLDSHALALEHMSAPGRSAALVAQPAKWRVLGAGDFDVRRRMTCSSGSRLARRRSLAPRRGAGATRLGLSCRRRQRELGIPRAGRLRRRRARGCFLARPRRHRRDLVRHCGWPRRGVRVRRDAAARGDVVD